MTNWVTTSVPTIGRDRGRAYKVLVDILTRVAEIIIGLAGV